MSETKSVPGFTGETFPEVFNRAPAQPEEEKPGQLSPQQLQQFFEQGFVVVENFFEKEELNDCIEACNQLVDEVAQKLYKAGKITELYEEYGFKHRLIMLEKAWPGAVLLLLKLGKLPKAFRDLWSHEKLLNAVEQMVGPEIAAHAVWNLRPKAPNHAETLVPWHQDSAYFDNDSYQTMVATAWIPFLDATRENGCLEFAAGGQKKGMIAKHECCTDFYLMLQEEEMAKSLDVDLSKTVITEVPLGGVLFFNNCVPHRSIPNKSDYVRWSIDLRWQDSRKPWGFFGLKPGVPMRSKENPSLKIDWDEYDSVDRYVAQKKYEIDKNRMDQEELNNEFDITLSGPWMDKFEVVKHSIHTQQYFAQKEEKQNR